jgi:hypothetical protein
VAKILKCLYHTVDASNTKGNVGGIYVDLSLPTPGDRFIVVPDKVTTKGDTTIISVLGPKVVVKDFDPNTTDVKVATPKSSGDWPQSALPWPDVKNPHGFVENSRYLFAIDFQGHNVTRIVKEDLGVDTIFTFRNPIPSYGTNIALLGDLLATSFTRANALGDPNAPGFEDTTLVFLRPDVCDFISNSTQEVTYGDQLVTEITCSPNLVGLYPILDDPENDTWSLLLSSIGSAENIGKGNGANSKLQRLIMWKNAETCKASLSTLLSGDENSLDFRYVAHVHSTDEIILVTGNIHSVDPKTNTTNSVYKVYSLPYSKLASLQEETTIAKLGLTPVLETTAPEPGLLLGMWVDQTSNLVWFAHGDKIEVFHRGCPDPSWTPIKTFTKSDLTSDPNARLTSVSLASECQISPVNRVIYGIIHPPLASGNKDIEETVRNLKKGES